MSLYSLILASALVFVSNTMAQQHWDELPPSASEADLRNFENTVLWWNIQGGGYSDSPIKELNENLVSISQREKSPRIIVLSEYHPKALTIETKVELLKKYRKIFVPYNQNHPTLGIVVFYQGDLSIGPIQDINWWPESFSEKEKNAFIEKAKEKYPNTSVFTRPFIDLQIPTSQGTVHILPLHLLQPWSAVQGNSKGLAAKIIGKVKVAKGLLAESENPIIYQIENLRRIFAERFGTDWKKEKVLIVGDMNLPSHLLGLPTLGFRRMSAQLDDVFAGRRSTTWPTKFSKCQTFYNKLQIDHALTTRALRANGHVLPMKGSDHYGLSVSF